MAKYHVNALAIEDIDATILIDAVARHCSATQYPELDGVLAILGIEKVNEEEYERNVE